jgi:hypothetical protein
LRRTGLARGLCSGCGGELYLMRHGLVACEQQAQPAIAAPRSWAGSWPCARAAGPGSMARRALQGQAQQAISRPPAFPPRLPFAAGRVDEFLVEASFLGSNKLVTTGGRAAAHRGGLLHAGGAAAQQPQVAQRAAGGRAGPGIAGQRSGYPAAVPRSTAWRCAARCRPWCPPFHQPAF